MLEWLWIAPVITSFSLLFSLPSLILTLPLQIFQPSPEPPTQLLILFGIIILISCLHWSCGHASVQITAPTNKQKKTNLFMSVLHTHTSAPKKKEKKNCPKNVRILHKSERGRSLELCSHLLLEVETAGRARTDSGCCHLHHHA